jgi:hypothetical protein
MIEWLSIEVNHPPMGELIIIKKNSGVVELIQLDSRHGIDNCIEQLKSDEFVLWSDTE